MDIINKRTSGKIGNESGSLFLSCVVRILVPLGALAMTVVFSVAVGNVMVTSDAVLNVPKQSGFFLQSLLA